MYLENIAIIGATGAVGKEMINCLFRLKYPFSKIRLYASERSAGVSVRLPDGSERVVEEFSVESILSEQCGIVLMAVSGSFSETYSPKLTESGCIVIDNSSAFRYTDGVPLIVPNINGDVLERILSGTNGGLIVANPNCTTAISAMVLYPIHSKFGGIRRLIASTYQAVSGAGEAGIQELEESICAYSRGEKLHHRIFSHDICMNVIPCIDSIQENGYTKEEMKLVWETRKIFSSPNMPISCTAVRVPTMRAHCISATIELGNDVIIDEVRNLLTSTPGVVVVDDPVNHIYPVPSEVSGHDAVSVGRIRRNLIYGSRGIDLFICGDQLLRGAALNAVEIALLVYKVRGASVSTN